MKRWLFYIALFGLMGMLGFSYSYHLPRLKTWLIVQIAKESRQHLPVEIVPQAINFHVFPVGISLIDIHVKPLGKLRSLIKDASIAEVQISPSLLDLLQGRLHISDIVMRDPLLYVVETKPTHESTITRGPKTNLLQKITAQEIINFPKYIGFPIDHFRISNGRIAGKFLNARGEELEGYLRGLSTDVISTPSTITAQISASSVDLRKSVATGDKNEIRFGVAGAFRLSPQSLQVLSLNLKKGGSLVRLSGELAGDIGQVRWKHVLSGLRPGYFLKLQGLFDLGDLESHVHDLFPNLKLPKVSGHLKADIDVAQRPSKKPVVGAVLDAENLQIKKFHIGDVHLNGTLRNGLISLRNSSFTSNAGRIHITKASAQLPDVKGAPVEIESTIHVDKLHLRSFLRNVNVRKVPLHLIVGGDLNCSGNAYPKTLLDCTGTLSGSKFKVWGEPSKHTIAAIDSFVTNGSASITSRSVKYAAKIQIGKSHGTSEGQIGYFTGFNIQYATTDALHFSDIKDLAGLHLQGSAKVKGFTKGDSQSAVFSMSLNGTNLWISKFGLGNLNTQLSYSSGVLALRHIRGTLGSSRYNADFSFNILKNQLFTMGEFPHLTAADLLTAFSRKVKLPVTVTGQGSARFKVSGPPQFNHLTYQLSSQLNNGTLAGETFDHFVFDVDAKKGEVQAKKVYLTKNGSTVTLTGVGHPDGNIAVKILGRNFKLEDSENVANFASNIVGDLNFELDLNGQILAPTTTLEAKITNTSLAEQSVGDSDVYLQITHDTVTGHSQLFGKQVLAKFVFPYREPAPFFLDLTTKNFDASDALNVLTRSMTQNDFQTTLTSHVHLRAPSGGFWNSTGDIQIQKLQIARGSVMMSTDHPNVIQMQNGHITIHDFSMTGPNSFLNISSQLPSKKKLDVSLNGKIDMSLLQILTPFLDDLRGQLASTCQLQANQNGADILGTAYIEHGLVKLKGFPHPFRDIKTDVLFDQRKILFNSITSELAGGSLIGQGSIEFRRHGDTPVDITAHLANVNLRVPAGVETHGNAELSLTGKQFPYLLKGSYHVKQGRMTRNFSSDSQATTIRQSTFLPPVVAQKTFSPVQFAINIDIDPGYRVQNTLVDSNIDGRLILGGTPDSPKIAGNIIPEKGGKILFRDTAFQITGASLKFTGVPDNPEIFLAAETHVHEFDITLLVQGTAQNHTVKLASSPSLTEQQIVTLLATGVPPENFASDESQRAAASGGAVVGSALFSNNPINTELQQKTGLQFNVTTENYKNPQAMYHQQVNQIFMDSVTTTVPKITISRQITPNFRASAGRTVGDVSVNDVKLRYNLNRNISVIGSWESQPADVSTLGPAATSTTSTDTTQNDVFGLDLEYQMEFK